MSRKLFVGNLPYSVTSERLQEAFSQFGTVASSKVIVDRETGRSRGFAFLEMKTDEMGAAAMQAMNGACSTAVRSRCAKPSNVSPAVAAVVDSAAAVVAARVRPTAVVVVAIVAAVAV